MGDKACRQVSFFAPISSLRRSPADLSPLSQSQTSPFDEVVAGMRHALPSNNPVSTGSGDVTVQAEDNPPQSLSDVTVFGGLVANYTVKTIVSSLANSARGTGAPREDARIWMAYRAGEINHVGFLSLFCFEAPLRVILRSLPSQPTFCLYISILPPDTLLLTRPSLEVFFLVRKGSLPPRALAPDYGPPFVRSP
jgi:hypothetical protein